MPYVPITAHEVAACSLNFVIVITQEEEPRLVVILGQSKKCLNLMMILMGYVAVCGAKLSVCFGSKRK